MQTNRKITVKEINIVKLNKISLGEKANYAAWRFDTWVGKYS